MQDVLVGITLVVAGVVFGAGVMTVILASRLAGSIHGEEDRPSPTVPIGVAQVIQVLRSAGIVLGPHDEVLQSSAQSRSLGLVRGSRMLQPELLELARQVRVDGQIQSMDLELHRDSAAPIYLASRVAPLDDGLVLILSEDRTAARRVDETRRDFVANVSHELKTPIGAVSLLAEAVEAAADDPTEVRRFSSRLRVEADRLSELAGQIIDLSRLQGEDPLANLEQVSVEEIVSDAVGRCRVAAEDRGISITVTDSHEIQILGKPELLTVALTNLVENAIAYSDAGAKVVVGARRVSEGDESFVDISVSDNGIGIAPSDTERIFERFYRVDYARSRANGGTGLGLAIVKHIVSSHSGQVSVWSHLGHGSTFTIRLPEDASGAGTRYDQPTPAPNTPTQEVNHL